MGMGRDGMQMGSSRELVTSGCESLWVNMDRVWGRGCFGGSWCLCLTKSVFSFHLKRFLLWKVAFRWGKLDLIYRRGVYFIYYIILNHAFNWFSFLAIKHHSVSTCRSFSKDSRWELVSMGWNMQLQPVMEKAQIWIKVLEVPGGWWEKCGVGGRDKDCPHSVWHRGSWLPDMFSLYQQMLRININWSLLMSLNVWAEK